MRERVTGKGCLITLAVASPVLIFVVLYSIDAGCFVCLGTSDGAFGFAGSDAQYALNAVSIIAALSTAAWLGYLIRTRW